MPRIYKVAFAAIELAGLFAAEQSTFEDALREAWSPGSRVTRYGRTWRISAPRRQPGDVLSGRMGFVREDEVATLAWDEKRKDFVRGEASGGVVVPFAVDLDRRAVAFQLVSGQVRPTSFIGAFEGLLNAGGTGQWSLQQLVERFDYERWSESVERVVGFRFRIERANPHYHDNDMAEQLLEDLRLAVASIQGRGADVADDSPGFVQLLDHVRRQYGGGIVRGTEPDGHESEWRSTDGGIVPAIERVESDDEEELPEDELPGLLDRILERREALYAEPADDQEDADEE